MWRTDSFEKTLMLGKIEGRRKRGWQRRRWLDGITNWWTWVWVNSGSWWWTGNPGVLWFMGSQRVRHDWETELNWSWSSNIFSTWCEELTHLQRPWFWERLKVGGKGDDRGWDGWMTSLTQWKWVLVNFGSWWWTWRPGMLQPMELRRFRHDWATELNWISN